MAETSGREEAVDVADGKYPNKHANVPKEAAGETGAENIGVEEAAAKTAETKEAEGALAEDIAASGKAGRNAALDAAASTLARNSSALPPKDGNAAVAWAKDLKKHCLVDQGACKVCTVCGASEPRRRGKIAKTTCIGFALATDQKTQFLQKRYVSQLQAAHADKDRVAKKLLTLCGGESG